MVESYYITAIGTNKINIKSENVYGGNVSGIE